MPYATRSPYVPQYEGRHARNIAELMLQRGDIEAQRAAGSGEALGQGIALAGQAIGQGLGIYGEQKRQEQSVKARAEQDARLTLLFRLSEETGKIPPPSAFIDAVGDPERGIALYKGFMSVQTPDQDPETAFNNLALMAHGFIALSPEMKAQFYPILQTRAGSNPLLQQAGIELPEVYNPETAPQIDQLVGSFAAQVPEDVKIVEGRLVGAKTGRLIYEAPPKPIPLGGNQRLVTESGETLIGAEETPDTRSIEARAADALLAGDTETYAKLIRAEKEVSAAGRQPERRKGVVVGNKIVDPESGSVIYEGKDSEQMVKLGAAALDRVYGADQGIQLAASMEERLNEDWLGPVQGYLTQARIKTPGFDVSEDLARFYADTATLKNAVVKAITGAQMSEPEAKRIMKQIPDFNDKPVVWRQKMEVTKANLAFMRERIIALSRGQTEFSESDPVADATAIWGGG